MTDKALYQAPADWLAKTVETLCAAGVEVVAPTKADGDAVELSKVVSADTVTAAYANTRQPLKRLFFPETEPILGYRRADDGDVDVQPAPSAGDGEMVVLGVRPCDAAALEVLDAVFQWDYDDLLYRARRDRATVVTFACTEPDEHCFCTSVEGSPHSGKGSDVIAFLNGDGSALLQPLSAKGQALIERLGSVVTPAADAQLPEAPAVAARFTPDKVRAWLDDNFESGLWQEAALQCLGCGACSFLCPTCHCFDIVDEGTWKEGERLRNWDCCSFALFTQHASGHNPRADQGARYRQRVMHKFKYFPERFGLTACVGCGRCTRVCGAGQSLVGVLSEIEAQGAEAP